MGSPALFQDVQGLLQGERILVGPPAGHRIEHIGDRGNAAFEGDCFTGQTIPLFADLHSESIAPGDLDDSRHWIDAADDEYFFHTN